jgi:hypothetical protein
VSPSLSLNDIVIVYSDYNIVGCASVDLLLFLEWIMIILWIVNCRSVLLLVYAHSCIVVSGVI